MNKLLCLVSLLLISLTIQAQVSTSCGGSVASTLSPPSQPIVCSSTVTVTVTPSSTPPTLEYIITDPNTLADDFDDSTPPVAQNLGPAILGTSVSSTIDPAAFGVTAGMTFEVTAVNYDLSQVQRLIDDLYNNRFIFTPCCTVVDAFYPGLCSDLMGAGITQGSDIQNLDDLLTLLSVIGNAPPGSTISIEGALASIDDLNAQSSLFPGPCGGNELPICYAIDQTNTATYFYRPIPEITLIEDACPTNPDQLTVTATSPAGGTTLEYSLDNINYQPSNILTATSNPVTVYVRESTCGEIQSEQYTIACALPVELLSFQGQAEKRNNLLKWKTAEEINFDYFVIEKAGTDLLFSPLQKIAGQSSGQMITAYEFRDRYPEKEWTYYRLKIVDLDGTFSYSNVVSIRSTDFLTMQVFPNPVSSNLFIELNNTIITDAVLTIYDQLGVAIHQKIVDARTLNNNYSISTADLPSGIYWLQVKTVQGNLSRKFVKQ